VLAISYLLKFITPFYVRDLFTLRNLRETMNEADERHGIEPRGTKRRSTSPPPWRRRQKALRPNYESTAGSKAQEISSQVERGRKDQVRLNQIQEDERSREWVAQEDDFVLKQAKKKAEIRVKDGRAKPIDWLAVALRMVDTTRNPLDDEYDASEIDVVDPTSVFEGLSEQRLSELEKDIDTFQRLEKSAQNKDYWRVSWVGPCYFTRIVLTFLRRL
jgi:Conserved mid region of cactin